MEIDRFTTKKHGRAGWALLLAAVILVTTVPSIAVNVSQSQAVVNPPYLDPTLKTEIRVDDLYSRLTLQEALSFLTQTSMPIPRLPFPGSNNGIPGFFAQNEALHGVISPAGMTVYPMSIGLGATFDPNAVYIMATQISDEARAAYNVAGRVQDPNWPNWPTYLVYYSPNVNMAWPGQPVSWGRTPETFGEDPCLVSSMAVSFVDGMQGTPLGQPRNYSAPLKVVTTPKHFVANQEDWWKAANGTVRDRCCLTANVDEKWLREYFFPGFEAAIKAGSESIMSAYNAIQVTGMDSTGISCTGNKWLLTDVLRGEWNFTGYVTSDCGAVDEIQWGHNNVATKPEAVAQAINAGLDMECGDDAIKYGMAAYDLGLIQPAALERAVKANLQRWFDLGLFNPVSMDPWRNLNASVIANDTHNAMALQLAEDSMVLLKNANVSGAPLLPLNKALIHSIAVTGPGADTAKFGQYSGTPAQPAVSPLAGIEAWASANGISTNYVPFASNTSDASQVASSITASKAAAAAADLSIIVCGLGDQDEGEGHDRIGLALPQYQVDYLTAVLQANNRSIVLINGGSPITMDGWLNLAPAVMMIWYPGEAGGTAIANILSGAVNPSGRLPMTFYKSESQVPAIDDYNIADNRTYMYLQGDPLFPFGYGLSYTNFTYSNLALNTTKTSDNNTVLVSLDVKNTGKVAGDDIVQIYVKKNDSIYPDSANLQLHGFKRVSIDAGATLHVTIPIKTDDLKIWDPAAKWVLEQGPYTIMAAESAKDVRLTTTLTIS